MKYDNTNTAIVFVEDGCFHRVHNNFDDFLEFVCVFVGKRKHK